jgi:hypothetical protein
MFILVLSNFLYGLPVPALFSGFDLVVPALYFAAHPG